MCRQRKKNGGETEGESEVLEVLDDVFKRERVKRVDVELECTLFTSTAHISTG